MPQNILSELTIFARMIFIEISNENTRHHRWIGSLVFGFDSISSWSLLIFYFLPLVMVPAFSKHCIWIELTCRIMVFSWETAKATTRVRRPNITTGNNNKFYRRSVKVT